MMEITLNAAEEQGQTECPICQNFLSDYADDRIVTTTCMGENDSPNDHYKHFYHQKCIVGWFHTGPIGANKTCPTCRSELKLTFAKDAAKINEKLNKIGWGFEYEYIERED
ncbi:unnamed protein product [Meloidogyne enterolobii]|uniref:Uncharacterized protein n=1 Tax=Meloidogyne enterolobii TaxID=390850 RepID=A0ACB0ZNB7_MELEN